MYTYYLISSIERGTGFIFLSPHEIADMLAKPLVEKMVHNVVFCHGFESSLNHGGWKAWTIRTGFVSSGMSL